MELSDRSVTPEGNLTEISHAIRTIANRIEIIDLGFLLL